MKVCGIGLDISQNPVYPILHKVRHNVALPAADGKYISYKVRNGDRDYGQCSQPGVLPSEIRDTV